MALKKYLVIGAGVLVAAALALGGYWWNVESHRRKEAQQRAEQRSRKLEEGLRELLSQDRLGQLAKIREQLTDNTNETAIRRVIPAWASYRERAARCNLLLAAMSEAASQDSRKDLTSAAAHGFTIASKLFVEVSGAAQKAQDETLAVIRKEQNFSTDELSWLDRMQWRLELYNLVMELAGTYAEDFAQSLRLLAVNSATPAERLEAFEQAADAFPLCDAKGGAQKLGILMRQAHDAEDDPPTRVRMNESLMRLKILPAAAQKPEPKDRRQVPRS
jgi:hypothetical protein